MKVGKFANAKGGRFVFDPAQVAIGNLGPGWVGCKDAPLAKAKVQLSNRSSIYLSLLILFVTQVPEKWDSDFDVFLILSDLQNRNLGVVPNEILQVTENQKGEESASYFSGTWVVSWNAGLKELMLIHSFRCLKLFLKSETL